MTSYYEKNRAKKLQYQKDYNEKHKSSIKEYKKEYQSNNKNELNAISAAYRLAHKNELQDYFKIYQADNKESISEYQRTYYQTNKKELNSYHNEYLKNKRQEDASFALRSDVSRVIAYYLAKNGSSKDDSSILQYLPYSFDELKVHLEQQFEPWMNWNNRGVYDSKTWKDDDPTTWTWQLDHIIPQSDLPYVSMEDNNFKRCWALKNLRPLSAKQNMIDGSTRIRHGVSR